MLGGLFPGEGRRLCVWGDSSEGYAQVRVGGAMSEGRNRNGGAAGDIMGFRMQDIRTPTLRARTTKGGGLERER